MEIGARIKKLRMDRKLGQAELAALLGIVQSTLSKIERGILRPTVDVLMRLAQLCGIPPGDLLTPLPPVVA